MIGLKKSTPERQARRFFLKKKWGKAIEEYQKCLSQDERNLGIVNLLGDAYFQKKDEEEAFEYYRKALSSFESEGLYDNAIAIAKKIARLDPVNGTVQLKLAQIYTDQEFLADALAHLNTYLRLVGKKIDEKLVRSVFQKMAGMTVRNPRLCDQIAALYQKSGINDPELASAFSPDRAAQQKLDASKFKAGITLSESDEMDTIETLEGDGLEPSRRESSAADVLDSGLVAEKHGHPGQELRDGESEGAERYADQMIARMGNIIREKAASEVESGATSEVEKGIEFTNILNEILPSDDALTARKVAPRAEQEEVIPHRMREMPATPHLVGDDRTSPEAYLPDETITTDKLIMDAVGPTHEAAQDEPLRDMESSGTSELSPEHVPETPEGSHSEKPVSSVPQAQEKPELTAPTVSVEVEEPKSPKEKPAIVRTGEESDVFWTLPFEVAEETAPDAKEELTTREDQSENLAVETMLTGFSSSKTSEEEHPPIHPVAYGTTEPAPETPTVEPHAAVRSDDLTDLAGDTVSLTSKDGEDQKEEADTAPAAEKDADATAKKSLQSLELSEVAAMNRDERLVGASFDGKEHYDMGKIYKEMKLWDAAIAEFKTAATDLNWRAKSCIVLAECFKEKGDVALAISQLKWALSAADELKDESDEYDLHYVLGQIYERGGNLNEAKEEYQVVHRWNPSHKGVEKKLMDLRKRMQKS